MLENIKITNFALISNTSVSFSDGFNVLTGETGAGKSLIVDALLFLTGVRADKTFIKAGEDYSRVEGVFSVDVNHTILNEILNSIGLKNEGTIIISRQFNLNGKNECRINGEIVTLNIVRKLSSLIIDIFGQNDSQLLLNSENHLILLDEMFNGKLIDFKDILKKLKSDLIKINTSIRELGGLDKDRQDNINFLEYQLKEINGANLYIGEEEELKNKIFTMQNSEKILSSLESAYQCLDGEISLENSIKMAINTLTLIESFDEDITKQKERLYSIRYELQDIVSEIEKKKYGVSFSEEDMLICQDKLMLIKDLERKYGNTVEDVLNKRDEIVQSLDKLINADVELERLRLNKIQLLNQIFDVCKKLREIRINEIVNFKSRLENELKKLGMKNAIFDVCFINDLDINNIEYEFDENGADKVEFLFSANLGVEPRSLCKIISGGELSRFMLAFKSLQNSNTDKTCIFDEIDTGIGGEIGGVVGRKICEIANKTQVICITHLAQIACFGNNNYKIEKYDEENKTVTSVRLLNNDDKINEIARMLSGNINTTSLNHAKEIIDEAIAYNLYIS